MSFLFCGPNSESWKVNGYILWLHTGKHADLAMCWSELSINKNNLKGDICKATNQCWKFFHPGIMYCHLVISPSAKSLKLQLSQKLTSWELVALNVSEKNFLGKTSFSDVLELAPSCFVGFCCDFSAEMTGHGNASGPGAFRVEIWGAEHMNEYSPLLPAPQWPLSNEKLASGTLVRVARLFRISAWTW